MRILVALHDVKEAYLDSAYASSHGELSRGLILANTDKVSSTDSLGVFNAIFAAWGENHMECRV